MLIVSAGLKQEGVTANTYEFEYWVEGIETEWWEMINEWFKSHGDAMYYVFLGCIGCCGVLILCCILVIIKNACEKCFC